MTVDRLYAIIEIDSDGNERFFSDLRPTGNYCKTYKPRVFKTLKLAEKGLSDWQNRYQRLIDYQTPTVELRFTGELVIREFKVTVENLK